MELFLLHSSMESLPIISNCLNANWPSFTALDTLTRSWCTRCGRRFWRKVSEMSTSCKNATWDTPPPSHTHTHTHPFCFIFMYFFACFISHLCLFSLSELEDTVAMSPVDRMRSLNLKLVSLGKIYAGTPRYFPLGKL